MLYRKYFLKFEKKHVHKNQLLKFYKSKKFSIKEVSSTLDLGVSTVHRKLHRYGIEVRPIGKKRVDITRSKLRLLKEKGLSVAKIARHFNCNQYTIKRRMKEYGIKYRIRNNSITHYFKKKFSDNPLETAYLIGFRLGDLTAEKRGKLIRVKMSTTKLEQIKLFKELFSKYTYIRMSKIDKFNAIRLDCYLNNSFDFLLAKKDYIPNWIYNNDSYLTAFTAGYVDAEGSFIISQNRGRFQMVSYDKNILYKFYRWLNNLGGISPRILLIGRKREKRSNGTRFKKNLWRLSINEAFSLLKFIEIIMPYLKHPKRKKDAERIKKNILLRKKQGTVR